MPIFIAATLFFAALTSGLGVTRQITSYRVPGNSYFLVAGAVATAMLVWFAYAAVWEFWHGEHGKDIIGYTPTPVISHAILSYNKGRKGGLADGIVITPSHNPPQDGGFKYNPARSLRGQHYRLDRKDKCAVEGRV